MKKFKPIFLALMISLCLTIFTGCNGQKASADGFEFTYKAKAEITSENNTQYLKIALAIKNTKNTENTLDASKFVLKNADSIVSTSAIIGNNIVDAMEEETFAQMATLDTTIMLTLTDTLDGAYELYYNQIKLFEINAMPEAENS